MSMRGHRLEPGIRRGSPFRHLLLGAGLTAAFATAGAVAVPALATNEFFECGSCTATNGPENFVKNTQAINHSGKGVCAVVWKNNGGGNYKEEGLECATGGGTATACAGSEFTGHGEAETSGGNSLLRGRQDNFASCG